MMDKEKNKPGPVKTSPKKVTKSARRIPQSKEIEELRIRLAEAEETLNAIRQGEVDALVVSAPHGEQIYTLTGAEHPYRVFFETMNEGGAVISTDGVILSCNSSFAELIGNQIEKCPGTSFYDFITPEKRVEIEGLIRSVCKTEGAACPVALRKEAALLASGGRKVPVQMAVSVKHDFDETHICIVVTDLTVQKQAEKELRKAHDTLEIKVRERTAELERSKKLLQAQNEELSVNQEELRTQNEELFAIQDELENSNHKLIEANMELEAFTYSVSHDLRAPLRHVSSFATIVLEDYADKLDETGKAHLTRIRNGSEKMTRLIDDLLNFSQISKLEVKRGQVDMSALASLIIANLRGDGPGRKVEINIKDGITASADHKLMDIVLTNLLGNAWKFTSKTDNAKIEFGAVLETVTGKIAYYVRDNGAGFNPDYKDKMFRPFQRLHSDKDFEGTGIGLAIVERIIRRHGGKIWAEGDIGKGATVYFTLG